MHDLTESDHAKLVEIDMKIGDAFTAQMKMLEQLNRGIAQLFDGQVMLTDERKKLSSGQMKLDKTNTQVTELATGRAVLTDGQLRPFDGQARLEVRLTQARFVTSSQLTLDGAIVQCNGGSPPPPAFLQAESPVRRCFVKSANLNQMQADDE